MNVSVENERKGWNESEYEYAIPMRTNDWSGQCLKPASQRRERGRERAEGGWRLEE